MREQNTAEVSVTAVTVKVTGQLLGHDRSHGDWTAPLCEITCFPETQPLPPDLSHG